ncbi:lactonase family protein [Alienimonas chondri]|uniref:6-phosphogluconolactonase n=1 Tax=Alienimonas chondri TaxID=2681879 RepID=A0ABX1VCA6_9PLAN|nr:lactonase family protein [Alienimonas chondri]NNJ25398.1 6-phosphogluconolactonase [Alienimonas chondri]
MLATALLLAAMSADPAAPIPIYLGTGADGIYRTTLDPATGELSEPTRAAAIARPGFLAAHSSGKKLYAVTEGTSVTEFTVAADGSLTETGEASVAPGGAKAGPCHVDVMPGGGAVIAANYGGGSVSSFPLSADGTLGERASFVQHEGSSVDPKRQTAPHAHCSTPAPGGRFAVFADLGLDKLFVYEVDPETGALSEHSVADTPPGGGPRHIAFTPDGRFAYCCLEMGNEILALKWDGDAGTLTSIETKPTLPEDWTGGGTTAEVRVHPSGKWVYVTNRGHNSIAVYGIADDGSLTPVEIAPATVEIPRGMNLTPDGRFLIACGQNTDDVVTCSVNMETGRLTPTGSRVSVPKPIDALPLPTR